LQVETNVSAKPPPGNRRTVGSIPAEKHLVEKLKQQLRRKEEASERASAELQLALEQNKATLRESDLALAASQHKASP
jgi:hypothetical protein